MVVAPSRDKKLAFARIRVRLVVVGRVGRQDFARQGRDVLGFVHGSPGCNRYRDRLGKAALVEVVVVDVAAVVVDRSAANSRVIAALIPKIGMLL